MQERPRVRVDIFPVVKADAVCAQIDTEKNEVTITALGHPKVRSRNSNSPNEAPVTLLKGKGSVFNVLLDGYCFYSPLDNPAAIMLTNLLLCEDSPHTPGIQVDKNIDPGMIALLGNNKKTTTVCGVTKDGKKILAYSVVELEESHEMKSVASSKSAEGCIGECVHEVPKGDARIITCMVSCAHHTEANNRHVIVGYNNGQIELYKSTGTAKLQYELTLKLANDAFQLMQLHVDNKGHLVAFSAAAQIIEVWNLSQAEMSISRNISKLSDVSISPDGAYIVARDNNAGHAESLHVYEFPAVDSTKLTLHRWETKHKIEAVAIGVKGSLLTAYNDEDENLHVMDEGPVRQLMQSKRSSYTLHAAENPSGKFKLSNVGATLTGLGKKPEGRRCLIKKHLVDMPKEVEAKSVVKMPPVDAGKNDNNVVVEVPADSKKKFSLFKKREEKKSDAESSVNSNNPPANNVMKN